MSDWENIVSEDQLKKTQEALHANGIESVVVEDSASAKAKVEELVPKGSEVMTVTSVTLEQTGIKALFDDSGEYDSVKDKLVAMNRETQNLEMQKLGAAPDYVIGSVHAITEDGKVVIASNTGSQLPGYAYGSPHVIWVVGAQKIVSNLDAAMERIYSYVLPLESERANKAYNKTTGSFVSKLLIVNREVKPGRITIVFVKEKLGF